MRAPLDKPRSSTLEEIIRREILSRHDALIAAAVPAALFALEEAFDKPRGRAYSLAVSGSSWRDSRNINRWMKSWEGWREGKRECPGWIESLRRGRYLTRTKLELSVELVLLQLGLPYEFQFRIDGHNVDFANPVRRLAIEADGVCFHSTRSARGHDAEIDGRIQSSGWRVVRLREDEEDRWIPIIKSVMDEPKPVWGRVLRYVTPD